MLFIVHLQCISITKSTIKVFSFLQTNHDTYPLCICVLISRLYILNLRAYCNPVETADVKIKSIII